MRKAKLARLAHGTGLGATRTFAPVAVGVFLAENPNRAKRNASPVGRALAEDRDGRVFRPTLSPDQRARTRAYAPLTVSHPTLDKLGRRNPRTRTSYTV